MTVIESALYHFPLVELHKRVSNISKSPEKVKKGSKTTCDPSSSPDGVLKGHLRGE